MTSEVSTHKEIKEIIAKQSKRTEVIEVVHNLRNEIHLIESEISKKTSAVEELNELLKRAREARSTFQKKYDDEKDKINQRLISSVISEVHFKESDTDEPKVSGIHITRDGKYNYLVLMGDEIAICAPCRGPPDEGDGQIEIDQPLVIYRAGTNPEKYFLTLEDAQSYIENMVNIKGEWKETEGGHCWTRDKYDIRKFPINLPIE